MPESTSLWHLLNDPSRLQRLRVTALLDSPSEEAFDRFTRLASRLLDVPVALISLVDEERQFFKSQVGLTGNVAGSRQTSLSHSFCKHVAATTEPLVISDSRTHPSFRDHPAIEALQVIAYLGVPLTTKDGKTLGALCTIDTKPRDWKPGDITALQDLAIWVMNEVELRLLAKEFQQAYFELREMQIQRDDLTYMLVHDLRNPILSLLMGLDLTRNSERLDAMEKQCLNVAYQSGESIVRMVSDILDVNKAESGKLVLNLAEVSPLDVIAGACAQVSEMANKRNVKLLRNESDHLPFLRADSDKLRRILVNLISNGIQHSPAGGTVNVKALLNEDTKSVEFSVNDSGEGIPKEFFGKIFEKFGQADIRNVSKISTGLGLPFCKVAVEAHGGSILVKSQLGQGTTFLFNIPLTQI